MSAKDCGNHHDHRKKLFRRLFLAFVGFTLLVLFLVLLIFLILRPTKPHFLLLDATVFAFNSTPTTSNLLTTTLQVTLSSRNPNARIGIYYDKLDIYASYRSQQITLPTLLPEAYQGHKDVSVWSPFLYGNRGAGGPVGTFVSGRYRLYVNCPAYIAFGNRNSGVPAGAGIKFQLAQSCHVDV
ncbi:NDR1/HIN1-like 1 [Actinidia rufa]|uniref:NDR1/HIN1-like 1 n=1 Tax=Actinidia rufa TaxID=165716 RepID=A0A7J0HAY7_9ERIC|nr:NDR1/HIN1-like 1 [Actinidia rufa]